MGMLEVSSFERPTADYLNRSLNDFAIDLLYYLNASAVGNLSSSGEMAPMSEFQRDSQEWKHYLSVVDRIFVGEPTINPLLIHC
jgi:hypothetical protein